MPAAAITTAPPNCAAFPSHVHSNFDPPAVCRPAARGELMKTTPAQHLDPLVMATDRPLVDVRVVLFTLAGSELLVAVAHTGDQVGLPRGLPDRGESLDTAARRIVRASTQLQEQYLEQLYTLSVTDINGDWSVIASYLALICSGLEPIASAKVEWVSAQETQKMGEADRMVVEYAVTRLRAKLGYTTIAFHLLPGTFTLTELQNAYETILGQQFDKRNFRRRMIASGILLQTTEKRRDGSHRPAALYRFRAEHDAAAYLTPHWAEPPSGVTSA